MATEFLMPKLGLTMEEGRILEWLVADGEAVSIGTPVLRIETDKVESDVESPAAGRLHRAAGAGDTFACGAVIGFLLDEGEEAPVGAAVAPIPAGTPARPGEAPALRVAIATGQADPARQFVSPNARRVATSLGVDVAAVKGTGPGGRVVSEDVEAAAATPPTAPTRAVGSELPATFAARQLADLLGVDLRAVPADPADGRVTRETVAIHVRQRLRATSRRDPEPTPAAPAPAPVPAPAPAPVPARSAAAPTLASMPLTQTPTEVRKLSGMRGTIAKRMHASLQEMAQLTLMMEADLDAVVADRKVRQAGGVAPGFTDYLVAATARALREHPIVNAQVTEKGIALLPDIHVGLAVAVPTGLMVPVIRHTDRLGLSDLRLETARLAEAGRTGQLKLADLEGGTFSVSTLGMFGVDGFTPVINPPNVAILGVGRIRDDVVLRDGAVTTAKRLTLSLTWDHRVLDGAQAAAFCQGIVKHLAEPAGLDAPA